MKVTLIGKPNIQSIDNKHYIALGFVGAHGVPIREIRYKDNDSAGETFKGFLMGEEIKVDSDMTEPVDFGSIEHMSDMEAERFLFEHREALHDELEALVQSNVIKFKHVVKLFKFSLEDEGIAGELVSAIMVKYLQLLFEDQNQVKQFLKMLLSRVNSIGGIHVDLPQSMLAELCAGNFPRIRPHDVASLLRIFIYPI